MDEIDRAFVDSLIPEGAVPIGFVAAVSWVMPDGSRAWRCYADTDDAVTTTLGMLELAKLDIVARSDTGLPLRYEDS